MPGYSGTPLPKKLGIKEGLRFAQLRMPADVKKELKQSLSGCAVSPIKRGALDFVFLFAKSVKELEGDMPGAARALSPTGMLWVAWPKKSSGVATDLSENAIRDCGLELGLVDIKVCAVTDIWSGLKFVIPVQDRAKREARG